MSAMSPKAIIEILLEKVRAGKAPVGQRVSFTVSDLERQEIAELKVVEFFMKTYGAEVTLSGKKNERHFSFILQEKMFEPPDISIDSPLRFQKFKPSRSHAFVH